jgi:hypothetical protein
VGATVTLYATKSVALPTLANNYGYGQPGTALGSTTTGANGAFTLVGDAASCPAGQQAYIVAYGGNAGAGSNSAALLMAALGPCGSIHDNTVVVIDEPTTIAAAYAVGQFMTVSGGTTVNISAPANNNAATAACATSGASPHIITTGCAASGLAHAFLNAATLVNSTTGVANSTLSSGVTITATVPQALINTLANSVEACINSTGDIVTPTAPCAILMTNAGNPAIALNPSLSAPADTLSALLDLAQYPSVAADPTTPIPATCATPPCAQIAPSTATANLFTVANSNAYYAPALSAAPLDFTIAINYVMVPPSSASLTSGPSANETELSLTAKGTATSGYVTASGVPTTTTGSGTGLILNITAATGAVTGGSVASLGSGYALGDKIYPTEAGADGTAYFTVVSQGKGAPWGIATDINDNVYVYVVGSTAGGPASPTVYSLTSDGAQNWATTTSLLGGCATGGTRCGVIPDTINNVWVTDKSGLTGLNATSGALGTTFPTIDTLTDATVDLGNNVWGTAVAVTGGTGSQSNPSDVEELPQGAGALVDVQAGSPGAVVTSETPLRDPVFDSAGNLWAATGGVAGTTGPGAILLVSNGNSLTAPDFSYSGGASNPLTIAGGTGANLKSMSPMLDAGGNLWIPGEDELNYIPSSGLETGGAQNYATSMTLVYGGASGSGAWESTDGRYAAMDGDGKIVVSGADGGFGYVSVYYPNAPSDGAGGTGLGGANTYLNPCFPTGTPLVCAANSGGSSQIMNASRMSAIDASGAIWATLSSGSNMVQILGPGAPTWSQLSYKPLALQTNTSERPY